eukprot:12384.XXX_210613_210911_1 [CDS] Oithona nana genome sequencing.
MSVAEMEAARLTEGSGMASDGGVASNGGVASEDRIVLEGRDNRRCVNFKEIGAVYDCIIK